MKNVRLEIRLTEYEARQLEEEATRRGMSKSELVRGLIGRLPDPSYKKVKKALLSATLPSSVS